MSHIIGHILTNDTILVWSPQDAIKLRREHRIVGSFIGALPTQPRQTSHYGLPLKLLPEETTLLIDKGLLKLVTYQCKEDTEPPLSKRKKEEKEELKSEDTIYIHTTDQRDINDTDTSITDIDSTWNWPITEEQKLKYHVFSDLWHRGYYLTPGLKYGGDYLVYTNDPAIVHSHFIAKIVTWDKDISPLSLVQDGRLGSKVKKNTLLCSVDPTNYSDNTKVVVQYITLSWTGIS